MRKHFIIIRIVAYALMLIIGIGGLYLWLSGIPYLTDYVDGFLTHNIQKEKRTHHLWLDDKGQSDLVYILNVQDSILSNRIKLSELVDSIMFHKPSALGLDIELIPKETVADSILYSTLTKYNTIVLPYDRQKNIFPLGKSYNAFANVCYTNFGDHEDMPRFLAPYDIDKDGQFRTSFWARLWEIHANIPNGHLRSQRKFIDFNIKPVIHDVNRFEDLQNGPPFPTFHDLANIIVIIGNLSGGDDIFHVPIQDANKDKLSERHLMTGIEIIGRATLTIGDNELENNIFDRHRFFFGYICFLLLVIVFCLIHFMDCFSIIREYGNIFQILAGVCLFFWAKILSPSLDEQWFFFSIVAVFLLLGPVVADIEKALYQIIGRKFDNSTKS